MASTITHTVKLNNGVEIPQLGFGVFRLEHGEEAEQGTLWALEAGYRHIDTAAAYRNEESVGRAVARSGIPRAEIFITTKVRDGDQGYATTKRACEESLRRLGTDFVDLYLIHWPNDARMADTWRAMQELREEGKCRALGVSNFTVKRLDFFFTLSDEAPTVNQVEFHPFNYDAAFLAYCGKKGIVAEAYSPLTRAQRLDDPTVGRLARAHGKTPAQILIRWNLQHGVITIPKSARQARIVENADVFDFELSAEQMAALDALSEGFFAITYRPENWY
ncbi:MAG: aldo/keto reductase [Kiritimatiellae bacterium]|nr:aldo/keto reductase [Kiritimatiellia bacterium]